MISNSKYWEVKKWGICINRAKITSLAERIRKSAHEADKCTILEPFISIPATGYRRRRKTAISGKSNNFY